MNTSISKKKAEMLKEQAKAQYRKKMAKIQYANPRVWHKKQALYAKTLKKRLRQIDKLVTGIYF